MKFFFDENTSERLTRGMKEFGEDVVHLRDMFPQGAKDEDWLRVVGSKGLVLVTRDAQIRRKPGELAAYRRHNVGGFVLQGKNIDHFGMIQQVVRNWPRMKELAVKTTRPFLFGVPPKGTKFRQLL